MMDRRGMLGGLAGTMLARTAEAASPGVPVERFGPSGGGRAPIVLLHGSDGLTHAGRYEAAARALVAAGSTVYIPHYFEATGDRRANYREIGVKFGLWRQAIGTAIDGLVGDPAQGGTLAVVGFSLGGALALANSTQDRRIKAVVNFFGFFPEELARANRVAPTLTLHGDVDRTVPVENARRIDRRVRELGAPSEIEIYASEGHGLSPRSLLDAGMRANAFLGRYL